MAENSSDGRSPDGGGSEGGAGHTATPVSVEDVKRVVGRALSGGSSRIRLTYGQRLAIVNAPRPAGGTPV
jgi:hypothetical protein